MKIFIALVLVFIGTMSIVEASSVENLEIAFPDDKSADFEIMLSSQVWLKSGPVAVRDGDSWYFSDDNSLKLDNTDNTKQEDFVSWTFTWVATSNASYKTTTYLKMYTNHPVVVFGQVFDTGAAAGSKVGRTDQLRSSFPTFQDAGADLGSVIFAGGQVSKTIVERWPNSSLYTESSGGFPVVLFDEAMENTIVLSPLNTFMSSQQATWMTKKTEKSVFGFGIMDSIKEIPEEYAYETVLVAGQNVTDTMMKWGKFMQRFYNRDDSYRYSDYTINYLGYWTDNGACYHYCTGKYDNYEDALVDMKTYSDQQGIPYRYLQLDSWWYYKGHGGVKNWTAMTTVFPHGLSYIANVWKTPIMAHSRFWSDETDYAKQNGGQYNFIMNGHHALPTEYSFWLDLLGNASRNWNLLVYEHDALSTEYKDIANLSQELNLGQQWLMQMGKAAQNVGLTMLYSVTWVRHLLQAFEIPAVTKTRVSGDYHPNNSQWQIGDLTILVDSMGIAPFKDNLHSVKVEADCCDLPTTENAPELEATIAALSKGPVGIGDEVGESNKELIMTTCMSDGRLLRPTSPSKSLDSSFVQRAFGTNGPIGQLYAAYTEVAGLTWYYIVAAEMNASYVLKPSELPPSRSVFPKTSFPQSLAFRYNLDGSVTEGDVFSQISIPICDRHDFQYWVIAPLLPASDFALLGELNKIIPVSATRFQNILWDSKGYIIHVVGDPGENVTVSIYDILLGRTFSASCQITTYGTASYRVPTRTDAFGINCM